MQNALTNPSVKIVLRIVWFEMKNKHNIIEIVTTYIGSRLDKILCEQSSFKGVLSTALISVGLYFYDRDPLVLFISNNGASLSVNTRKQEELDAGEIGCVHIVPYEGVNSCGAGLLKEIQLYKPSEYTEYGLIFIFENIKIFIYAEDDEFYVGSA